MGLEADAGAEEKVMVNTEPLSAPVTVPAKPAVALTYADEGNTSLKLTLSGPFAKSMLNVVELPSPSKSSEMPPFVTPAA